MASSLRVDASGFSSALSEFIGEYTDEQKEVVFKAAHDAGVATRSELRRTSARQSGVYAAGWSMRTKRESDGSVVVTVYNRSKHKTLTHLLEKGHLVFNQYGRPTKGKGRVAGDGRIATAYRNGSRIFLEGAAK